MGAAVQELRELYHDGTMATVTWLRAHGQLADARTKPGRDTSLQQIIRSGAYAVRLAAIDYLTKRSSAAPDQDGVIDNYNDNEADAYTTEGDDNDGDDDESTDEGAGETDKDEYE